MMGLLIKVDKLNEDELKLYNEEYSKYEKRLKEVKKAVENVMEHKVDGMEEEQLEFQKMYLEKLTKKAETDLNNVLLKVIKVGDGIYGKEEVLNFINMYVRNLNKGFLNNVGTFDVGKTIADRLTYLRSDGNKKYKQYDTDTNMLKRLIDGMLNKYGVEFYNTLTVEGFNNLKHEKEVQNHLGYLMLKDKDAINYLKSDNNNLLDGTNINLKHNINRLEHEESCKLIYGKCVKYVKENNVRDEFTEDIEKRIGRGKEDVDTWEDYLLREITDKVLYLTTYIDSLGLNVDANDYVGLIESKYKEGKDLELTMKEYLNLLSDEEVYKAVKCVINVYAVSL